MGMIASIRQQAEQAAQDAFHRRQLLHEKTGRWDVHLTREYRRLQMVADMLREEEEIEEEYRRDMAADTAEPDGFGLPDIALASVDTFDRWHQYLDR